MGCRHERFTANFSDHDTDELASGEYRCRDCGLKCADEDAYFAACTAAWQADLLDTAQKEGLGEVVVEMDRAGDLAIVGKYASRSTAFGIATRKQNETGNNVYVVTIQDGGPAVAWSGPNHVVCKS